MGQVGSNVLLLVISQLGRAVEAKEREGGGDGGGREGGREGRREGGGRKGGKEDRRRKRASDRERAGGESAERVSESDAGGSALHPHRTQTRNNTE